jgi:hypothetical protein
VIWAKTIGHPPIIIHNKFEGMWGEEILIKGKENMILDEI